MPIPPLSNYKKYLSINFLFSFNIFSVNFFIVFNIFPLFIYLSNSISKIQTKFKKITIKGRRTHLSNRIIKSTFCSVNRCQICLLICLLLFMEVRLILVLCRIRKWMVLLCVSAESIRRIRFISNFFFAGILSKSFLPISVFDQIFSFLVHYFLILKIVFSILKILLLFSM